MNRPTLHFILLVVGIVVSADAQGDEKSKPLVVIPIGKDEAGHRVDYQWMAFDSTGQHLVIRASLPIKDYRDDFAAIEVYSVATGKRITSKTLSRGGWNTQGRYPICAISPKGDWVAYRYGDEVRFLTIPPHKPSLPQKVYVSAVFKSLRDRLWADTDGKGLFALYQAEDEYSLRWWDLSKVSAKGVTTSREVFRAEAKAMNVSLVALNVSAGRFAAALKPDPEATEEKPSLQTWTLGEKPVKTEITLPRPATALAISPDGKRVTVGFPDGSVAWYDIGTKKCIKHIALPVAFTTGSVAFHPGGRYIACGTFDARALNLFLLDSTSGEIVVKLLADGKGVSGVCFNESGNRLAVFGSSGTITIWDADKLLKLEKD